MHEDAQACCVTGRPWPWSDRFEAVPQTQRHFAYSESQDAPQAGFSAMIVNVLVLASGEEMRLKIETCIIQNHFDTIGHAQL